MSRKAEKAMQKRLDADRARSQAAYGGFEDKLAPERAAQTTQAGERYGELLPQFKNLAETGGFDPTTTSNLKGFWGGSMATGGYGAGDISNIRRRANAAIPAVYSRLKEGARRAGIGGLNPAYGATMAKFGRQSAQEAATTSRDTEAQIAEMLRSGKVQGAQGLQGLEEQLRVGKLAGIGGQQDLYQSNIQQKQNIDANVLRAMGQGDQATAATYSPDLALATRPGVFSNILQGIGAATSFASPFMSLLNGGAKAAKAGMGREAGGY